MHRIPSRHPMPTRCPSCDSEMTVTELTCTACGTAVRGHYDVCPFCQLDEENRRFLEIFITCRGNVKEMERETGLGYWTIRNRLDTVIEQLEAHLKPASPVPPGPPKAIPARRREILLAVERGELSIEEAEQQLRALARHG